MEAEMAAEIEEAVRNYVLRSPRQSDDDREDSKAVRQAKAHYEIEAAIRKKYNNKRIFEDSDTPEPKRAKALVDGILHFHDWAFKIWDGLTLEEKQDYLGLDEPRKTGVDYLDWTAARVLLSSIEANKPWAFEIWDGKTRAQKQAYVTLIRSKLKTSAAAENAELHAAIAKGDSPMQWRAKKAAAEFKAMFDEVTNLDKLTREYKSRASSGGGRSRKPRYNTYRKKKRKITKRRRYKKTLRR